MLNRSNKKLQKLKDQLYDSNQKNWILRYLLKCLITMLSLKDLKIHPQNLALLNQFIKRSYPKLLPKRNCCSLFNKINKVVQLLMKLNKIDKRFCVCDVARGDVQRCVVSWCCVCCVCALRVCRVAMLVVFCYD